MAGTVWKRLAMAGLVAGTFFLGAALVPGLPAHAMNSDEASKEPPDPDKAAGETALKAGKFADAVAFFMKATVRLPNDPDLWNEIGYSSRKLGNFPQALAAYQKALAIKPNHRGALEYLGELYIDTGNMDMAKQQLAKLDKICTFGCAEYRALKAAIANQKTSYADTPGGW